MGNYVSQKMISSQNYTTHSSDNSESEPEVDSEESSTSSEDSEDSLANFDSAIKNPIKKYSSEVKIEDINEIETSLDLSEYISVIFLLFDDTYYALQVIRSLIAAGPDKFSRNKLYVWACTSKNWNYKLLEALAIVQNYKCLFKLGLCRKDIDVKRDAPIYVNKLKKILYSSLCECLLLEQAKDLIDRVRCDGKFKEDITMNCNPIYIEFHILFWIHQGYICIERKPYLDNLTKHLEFLNLIDVYKKINQELDVVLKSQLEKSEGRKITDDDEEDIYEIKHKNNPGLVVVVNNANFSKNIETRAEFKDKLPSDPIDDRLGSEKDVQNLRKTFNALNYTVVVRNDIYHDKLVDDIYKTVRKEFKDGLHSVLILCVLSHGDKGVVYGANSVPIEIAKIINSVSGSSPLIDILLDIPKVIIIQACQGNEILFAHPDHNLLEPDSAITESDTTDGPADIDGGYRRHGGQIVCDPKDIVVCMATIEGYAALRSPVVGSKYIQEICRCIDKYHKKKHFMDIMTVVTNNVAKEKCLVKRISKDRNCCMVPVIEKNVLLKPLYLSPRL